MNKVSSELISIKLNKPWPNSDILSSTLKYVWNASTIKMFWSHLQDNWFVVNTYNGQRKICY